MVRLYSTSPLKAESRAALPASDHQGRADRAYVPARRPTPFGLEEVLDEEPSPWLCLVHRCRHLPAWLADRVGWRAGGRSAPARYDQRATLSERPASARWTPSSPATRPASRCSSHGRTRPRFRVGRSGLRRQRPRDPWRSGVSSGALEKFRPESSAAAGGTTPSLTLQSANWRSSRRRPASRSGPSRSTAPTGSLSTWTTRGGERGPVLELEDISTTATGSCPTSADTIQGS